MRSYKNLKKGLFVSFIVIISTFQSVNLAASNVVTLDNGKSGTSSTGTWKVSSVANPYGSNSYYSDRSGDTYTYKFNLAAPGEYQVFARWTEWSNRRTSVPYDISHLGGTSTVNVNQRQNGGRWNQLGSIWSFGSTATIKLRSLGNGITSADAIKLVPVDGNIAPVVTAIWKQSVNEGDTLRFNVSATDSDGTSPVLSAEKLPANAVFIDNNNGTGTFSWPTTSGDAGNYNVTFIATDTSDPTVTGRKTVSISVVDGTGPVILDNGKSGTSSTGTWKVSSVANPYGSNSYYSDRSGDTYTYKFNLAAPGEYQVFARWTEWSNRRTSVPYDISHLGGTSTVNVNQRQNGGRWNQLGSIWSFGSTATIKLRSLGNGITSADAIKLVPVGGNIAPVVTTVGNQSVNAGDTLRFNVSATDSYGTSPVLSAEKLPANAVFIDNNNGTGVFTWPSTPGDAGNYNVTFIATDTSDPTVTGRKTVSISVVDGTGPVILDNGKSGTSSTGTWKVSSVANPYGSNSYYSDRSGDTYTYKFNLAAPGEYQVFARWTEWSNRRTSVPYDISHLGGTSTVNVNQRQNGGQWNQLGSIWSFGSTATIKLRSLGNGITSADAIKLVPVDGNIAPAQYDVPTTSARYLSEDFESANWADKFYTVGKGKSLFRTSGVAARTGSYGIRINVTKGQHWGGRILFNHARNGQGGNFTEIWTRYYVRFGPNWNRDDGRMGKAGFRARSDESGCGAPCLEMTDSHELHSSGALAGYSYFHKDVTDSNIKDRTFAYKRRDWTGGLRERDQWYCMETHHVLNTPGVGNGVYQNWVNGILVSDQRDIRQRASATFDIDSSVLIAYIGGGWVADRNMNVYFDDWAVSDKRIGCL